MSNTVTIQLPDGNTTTVVTESGSSLSVVAPSENSINLVTDSIGNISVESPSTQSVSIQSSVPSVLGVIQQDSNQITISSAVTQTSASGSAWGSITGNVTDQTDLINYIASQSSGGGTWGSITGTLSNQSDLQAALDAASETPTLEEVTAEGASSTRSITLSGGLTLGRLVEDRYTMPSSDGIGGQILMTNGDGGVTFEEIPEQTTSWGEIQGTVASQTDLTTYVANQISTKEDSTNKSTDASLGSSDVFFPTQNAVKTYVDTHVSNEINNYDMFANYRVHDTDEDGLTLYVGKIKATDGAYLIERYVETSGDYAVSYANSSNNVSYSTFSSAWAARTTLSYATIDSLTEL